MGDRIDSQISWMLLRLPHNNVRSLKPRITKQALKEVLFYLFEEVSYRKDVLCKESSFSQY